MPFFRTNVPHIAIVDFGMGNLHSVLRRLERIGTEIAVTPDPDVVRRADKLVLPGVGHFAQAMENLADLELLDALHEAARVRRVPVLGICLGMQLMATRSEEGDTAGLGWVDADVVQLRVPDRLRFKVPHIGWGCLDVRRDSLLLKDLPSEAEFYFVHSYSLEPRGPGLVVAETTYAQPFTSAIEQDNLFGVQFHPEKSHASGECVLRNFVEL